MNIECPEEIPDESVPMKITLYDNRIDAVGRLLCAEGEIHVRGATASAYPKKGFRFSLKTESPGDNVRPNHLSLLGMRQDDDWLLYAAYNDQEKVRNVFSSNLWEDTCASDNALGIDFGMEYRYLELFINGKYWGLYALGYPIDEKQVCIDSDSQDAILYKHGLGSERLRFTKDGGIFGESPDNWEQTALQHYYYEIYRNADNNDRLLDGIDLDNAIDFYLFLNLVQGEDNTGLIKNYYILLQKENGAAKGLYAPWDLDLTWGNHYIGVLSENFTYPYGIREDFNCIVESGILYQLMINGDAAVWERVFGKYHAFRENEWSDEAINALIDKYEADIFESGAYLRDMERWPEGTYGNASDGLSVFRAYVMNRLREADLYYERLEKAYEETSNVFIRRLLSAWRFSSISAMASSSDTAAGAMLSGIDTNLPSWRMYGPNLPTPTDISLPSNSPSRRGSSKSFSACASVMPKTAWSLRREANCGFSASALSPICTTGPNLPILTDTGFPVAGSFPSTRSPTLCSRRMPLALSTSG